MIPGSYRHAIPLKWKEIFEDPDTHEQWRFLKCYQVFDEDSKWIPEAFTLKVIDNEKDVPEQARLLHHRKTARVVTIAG